MKHEDEEIVWFDKDAGHLKSKGLLAELTLDGDPRDVGLHMLDRAPAGRKLAFVLNLWPLDSTDMLKGDWPWPLPVWSERMAELVLKEDREGWLKTFPVELLLRGADGELTAVKPRQSYVAVHYPVLEGVFDRERSVYSVYDGEPERIRSYCFTRAAEALPPVFRIAEEPYQSAFMRGDIRKMLYRHGIRGIAYRRAEVYSVTNQSVTDHPVTDRQVTDLGRSAAGLAGLPDDAAASAFTAQQAIAGLMEPPAMAQPAGAHA